MMNTFTGFVGSVDVGPGLSGGSEVCPSENGMRAKDIRAARVGTVRKRFIGGSGFDWVGGSARDAARATN